MSETKYKTLPRVSPTIEPEIFYQDYVRKRQPAVFDSMLTDPEWNASELANLTPLLSKDNAPEVLVERRTAAGHFGSGLKRLRMPVSEFIEKIKNGDENLYLSTQYELDSDEESAAEVEQWKQLKNAKKTKLKENNENSKDDEFDLVDDFTQDYLRTLLPPPTGKLIHLFPHRPVLLGNLVPQQYNLWMGSSGPGTSSGLHHDYHDNLYILLRGRKRFTLFPPQDAPNLYLRDPIGQIHSNGLIVYEALPFRRSPIRHLVLSYLGDSRREDGVHYDDLAWEEAAKRALSSKPHADQNVGDGALDHLDEMNSDHLDEDDNEDDVDDDGDDDDGEGFDFGVDGDDDSLEAMMDRALEEFGTNPDNYVDEDEDIEGPPSSFSFIPPNVLHGNPEEALEAYPLMANTHRYEITLEAGQMLYLPASWMHEVTSLNGSDNYHLAFNYWVFPPSQSDSATFARPHCDGYWQDKWEKVKAAMQKHLHPGDATKRPREHDTDSKEAKRSRS